MMAIAKEMKSILNRLTASSFALIASACFSFAQDSSASATASGEVDARMLRYPDVSATQIVFVYAGDIWVAPKTGGVARRLSSPRGEETFPRFSPDGSQIAFSGNYDGNIDIYVVPATRRVAQARSPTTARRTACWTGIRTANRILFATSRTSEKDRFNQLYRISAERRPAGKAAGALRRIRRHLARWQDPGLHPHLGRFPHLETLSRRHEPGHLAVRPGDVRGQKHHRQ